jgi:hypothetical protein
VHQPAFAGSASTAAMVARAKTNFMLALTMLTVCELQLMSRKIRSPLKLARKSWGNTDCPTWALYSREIHFIVSNSPLLGTQKFDKLNVTQLLLHSNH